MTFEGQNYEKGWKLGQKILHYKRRNGAYRNMKKYCTDLELCTSTTTINLLAPVIKLWEEAGEGNNNNNHNHKRCIGRDVDGIIGLKT